MFSEPEQSVKMPRLPLGRFNLIAKIYFLKYPHCSLTKEEALSQLQSISTTTNKKYIKICRELHENGEPHLHALIQFERKHQFSNQSLFDLFSPNRSSHFHPNIQVAKSSSDFKSFIDKDGDTVEWGEFQISSRGVQQTANEAYAKALNTGNKEQALETIRELAPLDFALHSHTIASNLDRIFAPPIPPYQPEWPFSSFTMPPELEEWVNLNFVGHPDFLFRYSLRGDLDRPLSVVIEGELRTGKTAWARSIGKHNYLSQRLDFNSEIYSNEAHYNVIDNVSPEYLKKKHWKELLGAKSDWQANCRHGKPVMIKGGIPSIVLCNPGKGSSYKDFLGKEENQSLLQWTTKNVIFITLQEPLYSTAKSNT